MARRAHPLASPLVGEAESRQRPGEGGGSISPEKSALPPSPGRRYRGDSTSPIKGEGRLVLLGEFGRAHGLKGEVRLKSFTGDPKAIARYGLLTSEDGRSFTLKGVRPAGGGSPDLVIARVEGVATREAAEALNRIRLYALRERLQGAEGEDEFLLADLIGLVARDKDGLSLGTIVAVPNYGGGDLLDIAPEGGGATALLPFTESFVPEVRIADGYVVVDAPGLFSTDKAGDDV